MQDTNVNPLSNEDEKNETPVNENKEMQEVESKNEEETVEEIVGSSVLQENAEIETISEVIEEEKKQEEVLVEAPNVEITEGDNDEEKTSLSRKSESTLVDQFLDKDFGQFTQEKKVATLKLLLDETDIPSIKDTVDRLQASFYKEFNKKKKEVFEEYAKQEDKSEEFSYTSLYEEQFNGLLALYREKKVSYNKKIEAEKEQNLQEKYEIIDKIKELINKQESLSDTFKEFNELQERWRNIGLVPLTKVNELWRSYHHNVENFYDYIRINKELRDLDFKKNLEKKTQLLEEAKDLDKEKSVKKAFDRLQKLHEKWKEVGPVKRELREELWTEFKEASRLIHKKHQDYFVNLKNEQKENLAKKQIICDKVESLLTPLPESNKEWNKVSDIVKGLQTEWKSIGFAPKKNNQEIYERFRIACDSFFAAKRDAHKEQRNIFKENMEKKIQLCEMAEGVMDSDDWKITTDYLIELQKQWKEVGAVQYKYSQKLWNRFRSACDHFFDRKSGKKPAISEAQQSENLKEKQDIIENIKTLDVEDKKITLKELKDLQTAYHKIGFVPVGEKDKLAKSFDKALKEKFDTLEISSEEKEMQQYAGKYEALMQEPDGEDRIIKERLKLSNKIKQLENNVVVWGNNIGFFANSSNADKLIKEVKENIAKAKVELKSDYKKMRFLDKLLQ